MTSSPVGSPASLYKSAGPVQSPRVSNEAHSPPPEVATLPTPPSLSSRDESNAHKRLSNGSSAADNESEAETEILSDDDRNGDDSGRVKREEGHDEDTHMTDSHSPGSLVSQKKTMPNGGSRASVESHGRHRESEQNTHSRHDGTRSGHHSRSASTSPSRTINSRSSHPPDILTSRASSSIRASTSPTIADTDRRNTSPASRKRKIRDEHALRASEPPRQKHKSSKSTQQNLPSPRTASVARSHKRSVSTQSGIPTAQKRVLREVSLTKYSSRGSDSESGSEAQEGPIPSPFAQAPHLPRPRLKRSANSLTSPVRAMAPKKLVDRYGTSALARAAEKGDLETVRNEFEQHPQLLEVADNGGHTPLAKAALKGNLDVVRFLLKKNCKVNCRSKDKETPLMDAVENGHLEVVQLLLANGANPHLQNEDGHRAIDLFDDDDDDYREISEALNEAMRNYDGDDNDEELPSTQDKNKVTVGKASTRKDLFHVDANIKNLHQYASKGDYVAVQDMLDSNIKPDLESIIAAARGGHEIVLNVLLASTPEDFNRDPSPSKYGDETPLLAAIGRGHLEVLKILLAQEPFNPTRRTKDGKTYPEKAREMMGPKWEQEVELLQTHYDQYRIKHPLQPKTLKKRPSDITNLPLSKKPKMANGTSSKRREQSSSPLMPTKRQNSELNRVSKTTDDIPKAKGRLMSKAEIVQSREQVNRRRRVIEDEDSDDNSDSEVSRPVRRERAPSVIKKAVKKTVEELVNVDKLKTTASKVRRKSSSSTGRPEVLERRKSVIKQSEDKSDVKAAHQPKQHKPVAPVAKMFEPPPPPPVKESTPESVREERRKDAERLYREAEEKRLQEERDIRRREAEAREKRLSALPQTIRRACELGPRRRTQPIGNDREYDFHDVHLPIHVFNLEPDPFEPSSSKDDLWCFSCQAIGLLGLPEPDLSVQENWPYPTRPVTSEQRVEWRTGYPMDRLAKDQAFPRPDDDDWDGGVAEMRALQELNDKFESMPLCWVRFDDVVERAKESEWLTLEITKLKRSLRGSQSSRKALGQSLRDKAFANGIMEVRIQEEPTETTHRDTPMAEG